MSDEGPDRGWWLASDGQWYPPEQHPDYGARIDPGTSDSDEITVDVPAQEFADEEAEDVAGLTADDADDINDIDDTDDIGDSDIVEEWEAPEEPPVVEVPEESAEQPETTASEPTEPSTAADHLEGLEPGASLADQLLELSNRRVAGVLTGEEFAEAQRRLLTGDDAH